MQGRDKLVGYLQSKLVGPGLGIPDDEAGFEREIIEGRMSLAYMQGMLYPRQSASDDDTGGDEGKEVDETAGDFADADDPLGMATELLPASMGLTFCLEEGATAVLAVSAALYEKLDEKEEETWRRRPLQEERRLVTAGDTVENELLFDERASLSVLSRKLGDGSWLLTVSLANRLEDKHPNPAKTLYQVQLSATPSAGQILKYPSSMYRPPTEEERELRVIYGEQREYAVGHGVSCDWELDSNGACTRVATQALPTAHVWRPVFDSLKVGEGEDAEEFADKDLFQVCYLASEELDASELSIRLEAFIDFYEGWVSTQRRASVEEIFQDDAERIIDRCDRSAARMREGISILATNPLAFRAFVLANRAMLMSMCHHARVTGADREDRLARSFRPW